MELEHLINSDSVLCNAHARSKKHCLEILSQLLARSNPDIASEDIFAELIKRERLGCTGLARGIAFPHCRVNGARDSTGALIKLSSPVDFDSSDGEAVDLVFGLIVPSELLDSHRADITTIAELLDDDSLRAALRSANTSSDLYNALVPKETASIPEARIAGSN
jgi:PTS system nitrogen regulatory IIA component